MNIKIWASENVSLVAAMIRAKANHERVKDHVYGYVAPILARYSFTDDRGRVINNVDRLYLSDDEERLTQFDSECDEAHRRNGYNLQAGQCPALLAEGERINAENAVLESLEKVLGVEIYHTDDRTEALRLIMEIYKNDDKD